MADRDLRCKYEYTFPFGQRQHTWSVVGAKGGVHLHIRSTPAFGDRPVQWHGGLEVHHRFPPPYAPDSAPDHDRCHLLGGPCWHDGSSTAASEYWIPLWQQLDGDHDTILEHLCREYWKHFPKSESDSDE